ncbi:MAG: tetratricopeptide repeat protein [Reyranella sp.]|uniref:tetratricopeptide repeat protein n=1 Tax=Reyranella sp. TaxID=1929291 RepID=UPI002730E3CA|nr:tetratricopeptide repeat protein [Reyranella sp.]MDP1965653.1 tetratricopeptide repeat protein [Reyranella sp.]MDP2372608.1 tetratricopeptide repeat protein [Reyranella sp.]
MSNADAETVAALDFVREEWLAFGNRLAEFTAAADKEDKCLLLPLTAANLVLSMNSAEGFEAARRYVARAKAMTSGANARELAWLAATEAWIAGETPIAQQILEDLVAQWPRDLLAAKIGQLHAFGQGDAEGILRIGKRIVTANADNHYVWAMHAFGLEECNRLDEAEAAARKAIAMDRRDPWAHHAIAHCLEARGKMVEGVGFLTEMSDTWERCNSFMYTHLWWHLALFLIDLDRTDEALQLHDRRVWGVCKEFSEDQINAVSLLARLELRGVDVGERWADVATYLKPRLHEHFSPFLDLHYLYGLARAGEASAVTEMLASLEDRAERAKPFEREAWADCAVPAAHGLAAHAKGDHAEAARLLGQAMPHLKPIGGSIAQRGLFGAIHLDALVRADWNDAAMAILQADERERPAVAATKRALAGLYRKVGRTEQAQAAEYQAEQLARQYRAAQGPTTGRAA